MSFNNNSENDSLENLPENYTSFISDQPSQSSGQIASSKNEIAELHYFQNSDIAERVLKQAQLSARINRTTIEAELLASGHIVSDQHFYSLASKMGLDFVQEIPVDQILNSPSIDVLLKRRGPLRIQNGNRVMTLVTPSIDEAERLEALFSAKPEMREQFLVTTPEKIRDAVWQLNADSRVHETVRELPDHKPEMSAKRLMSNWQSFLFGAGLVGATIFSITFPGAAITMVHLFLSLLYLSFNLLKLSAGIFPYRMGKKLQISESHPDLPSYTILIALYDEAPMAQQLIAAMSRLKWPKSKLDIKLICEAVDEDTINALIAANPGPQFEIVKVPDLQPRTKPKALQYAMHGARGDFIAVYDAEDIPSPNQLLEAYETFSKSDRNLACLQAPLVASNASSGWLPALFSIEYSGLFRGLVPLLAHFGLPIPLGGTSNHFRKSAILAAGGWDPCNVTEDADLGIRLYRLGYRTGVLKRPTLERAPESVPVWIKQRTRWLKGWIQTWFVFMRKPLDLLLSCGLLGFSTMQILVVGMLTASLAHPFIYLFIILSAYSLHSGNFTEFSNFNKSLLGLDVFNLIAGYSIFLAVGWRAFISIEKKGIKLIWLLMTPIYWILMSIAGWRAITQIPNQLQKWEKTPHLPNSTQEIDDIIE